MRKLIIIGIALILLMGSCSPQRRLHRLITRHPELLTVDTIRIQDTTFIPGIKIDTIVHHSALKDTVIITKENLKLQLIEINDTIYIEAHQEPDTIILNKEILVERIIHQEPEKWMKRVWKDFKFRFVLSLIAITFLIGIVIRLTKRK